MNKICIMALTVSLIFATATTSFASIKTENDVELQAQAASVEVIKAIEGIQDKEKQALLYEWYYSPAYIVVSNGESTPQVKTDMVAQIEELSKLSVEELKETLTEKSIQTVMQHKDNPDIYWDKSFVQKHMDDSIYIKDLPIKKVKKQFSSIEKAAAF